MWYHETESEGDSMERTRCRWADPASELYLAYHDQEWGRPEHDDQKLFEMLILEGFQAGLSWITILKNGRPSATPLTILILPLWPGTELKSWRR